MQAVVAALDDAYTRLVEELWAELEREFGVRGIAATFPHITFLACEGFDRALLAEGLSRVAAQSAPPTVRADGLGIFIGLRPVLYIPIVRSEELTALHRRLWGELHTACSGPVDYYRPENWVPHITLAIGDLHKDNLAQMVRHLSERDFSWALTLDTLCLIEDTHVREEPRLLVRLGGTIAERHDQ